MSDLIWRADQLFAVEHQDWFWSARQVPACLKAQFPGFVNPDHFTPDFPSRREGNFNFYAIPAPCGVTVSGRACQARWWCNPNDTLGPAPEEGFCRVCSWADPDDAAWYGWGYASNRSFIGGEGGLWISDRPSSWSPTRRLAALRNFTWRGTPSGTTNSGFPSDVAELRFLGPTRRSEDWILPNCVPIPSTSLNLSLIIL